MDGRLGFVQVAESAPDAGGEWATAHKRLSATCSHHVELGDQNHTSVNHTSLYAQASSEQREPRRGGAADALNPPRRRCNHEPMLSLPGRSDDAASWRSAATRCQSVQTSSREIPCKFSTRTCVRRNRHWCALRPRLAGCLGRFSQLALHCRMTVAFDDFL